MGAVQTLPDGAGLLPWSAAGSLLPAVLADPVSELHPGQTHLPFTPSPPGTATGLQLAVAEQEQAGRFLGLQHRRPRRAGAV